MDEIKICQGAFNIMHQWGNLATRKLFGSLKCVLFHHKKKWVLANCTCAPSIELCEYKQGRNTNTYQITEKMFIFGHQISFVIVLI